MSSGVFWFGGACLFFLAVQCLVLLLVTAARKKCFGSGAEGDKIHNGQFTE